MPPFRLNPQLFNRSLYSRVRAVWFDGLPPSTSVTPPTLVKKWFGVGSADEKAGFDNLCATSFLPALDSIGPSGYTLPPPGSWATEKALAADIAAPFTLECQDADDALALVLLLDQIPRNIFREKQSVIYSHYDRLARALVRELVGGEKRVDLDASVKYCPPRRSWFYMPLMHSEFLEDHVWFQELMAESKKGLEEKGYRDAVGSVEMTADYGKRHQAIIERFGRYPHRNEWLGRETTKEEKEYMESGGESFGTKKDEKAGLDERES